MTPFYVHPILYRRDGKKSLEHRSPLQVPTLNSNVNKRTRACALCSAWAWNNGNSMFTVLYYTYRYSSPIYIIYLTYYVFTYNSMSLYVVEIIVRNRSSTVKLKVPGMQRIFTFNFP